MVSKYQKSKPSGYTIYVLERCSQAGIKYTPQAFAKFASDWKALEAETRTSYNDEAKRRTKIMVERRAAEISKPITFNEVRAQKAVKRKVTGARDNHEDGEDSDDEQLRWGALGTSSGVSQPALKMKRVLVGDDEGDCEAWVEHDPEVDSSEAVDVEADSTSEVDLWKHATDAYGNLEAIRQRYVFVISCTPSIFAQGWKKSSNNRLNRPVEIGVSIFSISNGIQPDYCHRFIHAGILPTTSSCDAEESGQGLHGIPLSGQFKDDCLTFHDNGFKASEDYYGIYEQILHIMGYDGTNADTLPPLFSAPAKVDCDEACLRWLIIRADIQAEEQNIPKLPDLRFSTLDIFARLAVFYRAQELPTQIERCTRSWIEETFVKNSGRYHRNCLPKLSCTYHDEYNPIRVCAIGVSREACYILLMILKNLFQLPQATVDGRFVYVAKHFPSLEVI